MSNVDREVPTGIVEQFKQPCYMLTGEVRKCSVLGTEHCPKCGTRLSLISSHSRPCYMSAEEWWEKTGHLQYP